MIKDFFFIEDYLLDQGLCTDQVPFGFIKNYFFFLGLFPLIKDYVFFIFNI